MDIAIEITLEEKVIRVLEDHGISKKSHTWRDYESAKMLCLAKFDPTVNEYKQIIDIICEWLDL